MMRAAAITGAGCVTGFGVGVEPMWRALLNGQRALRERGVQPLNGVRTRMTAQAPSLEELQDFVSVSGFTRLPRTTLLAKVAAEQALAMAGLTNGFDRDRIGFMINRHFGQHDVTDEYQQTLWDKGPGAVSGLQFVQSISNAVLGRIAIDLQLRGPSILSFGPLSLEHALDVLRNEQADAVLIGGVDEASELVFLLCDSCGISPASQGQPEEVRPYDLHRSGLIPGDGAIFLVLEQPTHAAARGATSLGYLRGCASVSDRASLSNQATRHKGDVVASINRALQDAELLAADLGFVSGAAAGLRQFDEVEAQAIADVVPGKVPVTSIKGALGETWAAAGGLSLLTALLALRDGKLPPTVGTTEVDPACPSRIVINRAIDVAGEAALALSLDMTGQNCAYVVSKAA
jgi:3-oxoacyl-(acyl-carrier-protein) synthase